MAARQNNLTKEKIVWVDVYKALLIIAVVVGHAWSPLVIYIYLFHMPGFIVVSGYTNNARNYKYFEFVKRKFLTLLAPFLVINFIYIVLYWLTDLSGCYSLFQEGKFQGVWTLVKSLVRNLSTTDLGGATWFLPMLFGVEVLFKTVSVLCEKLKIKQFDWVLLAGIAIAGWICIRLSVVLPYSVDLCFYATAYYAFGVLAARYNILGGRVDHKVLLSLSATCVVFFGSFYFATKLPMNWPTRQFPDLFINLLSSLSAMYLIYRVADYFSTSWFFTRVFRYIGSHTYCLFVTHFLVFRILFILLVLAKIVPVAYLKNLTPATNSVPLFWLLISIATISICLLLSYFAEKNLIFNYVFNARLPTKRSVKVAQV